METTQERIIRLYSNKSGTTSPQTTKGKATYTPPKKTAAKPVLRVVVKGLARPLRPYQEIGVGFLEMRKGRAILGDDMGLGKTAQVLAFAQHHKEARPAIITCPSSLKYNWAKEIFMWTEKCKENSVYILSGRTKKLIEEVYMTSSGKIHTKPCKMPTTGFLIVNYDILANKQTKSEEGETKSVPNSGWVDPLFKLDPYLVISDEAHYLKNKKTGRTIAVSKLAKTSEMFIPMTGTLIENKPSEGFVLINLVAPKLFPSFWNFAMRYCGPKSNGFGWDFTGASNTGELHEKLKEIMIRRMKSEVLTELPPKVRTVVPVEINNRVEYLKAEDDFIGWIRNNKGRTAANKAGNAEGLARINVLKQICMKGKIDTCLDWIEDYLSNGKKLVVFTNHTWVLNHIFSEFEQWAVKIDGSCTPLQKELAVQEFQTNRKIKLCVGNLKAAGEGTTLTAASATCTIELGWNPMKHNQAEDRVHRMGQTADSVDAYYLLAQGTIEEELAEMLDLKRDIVTAVLDGKTVSEETMLAGLLKRIEKGDK